MIDWQKYDQNIWSKFGDLMEYRPIAGTPIPNISVITEYNVEVFGDYGNVAELATFFNVQKSAISELNKGDQFLFNGNFYEVVKGIDFDDNYRNRFKVKRVYKRG